MNILLSAVGDWFAQYWFILLIIILMIAMLVPSFLRQKKELNARSELQDQLKKGTRVITTAGVYGVVESIELTTDGKVVTIVTGNTKHPTTMTIHINAIGGIDNKTPVVEDMDGNVVEPKKEVEENEEVEEIKAEEHKPTVEASKLSALVEKMSSNKEAKTTSTTTKSTSAKKTPAKKSTTAKKTTSSKSTSKKTTSKSDK